MNENPSISIIVPYQPLSTLEVVYCTHRALTSFTALSAPNGTLRTCRGPYGC